MVNVFGSPGHTVSVATNHCCCSVPAAVDNEWSMNGHDRVANKTLFIEFNNFHMS